MCGLLRVYIMWKRGGGGASSISIMESRGRGGRHFLHRIFLLVPVVLCAAVCGRCGTLLSPEPA